MSWATALKLGRVSNLPTVWTNALTGLVLGGGTLLDSRTLPLLIALSLFYVGGMYLNDAFDADIDREERPDRPIPSGAIDVRTVMNAGITMFVVGLCLLLWVGFVAEDGTGGWPAVAGLVLVTAIVVYDWHHKGNPFSPYLMGVCRMMVYVTAGLCFLVPPPAWLLLAAVLLFSYLIGLTAIARQETQDEIDGLWPLFLFAPALIYGVFFHRQRCHRGDRVHPAGYRDRAGNLDAEKAPSRRRRRGRFRADRRHLHPGCDLPGQRRRDRAGMVGARRLRSDPCAAAVHSRNLSRVALISLQLSLSKRRITGKYKSPYPLAIASSKHRATFAAPDAATPCSAAISSA